MNNAYEYVIKNGGIDTETDYNYCEWRDQGGRGGQCMVKAPYLPP